MTASDSEPPTVTPSTQKASPKSRWITFGIPIGIGIVAFLGGFFLGLFDFLGWVGQWRWKDLEMSVWTQPLATVITGLAAIGAAGIALSNGNRTREQDRTNQEIMRKHEKEQQEAAQKHAVALQEEAARKETERGLRDRFFKITETLSESTNYVKREAGVYALVALADDWAVFHHDNLDAAKREQQTCLNVIAGQLRDPLNITTPTSPEQDEKPAQHDPALMTFKHRVQDIILERFRTSPGKEAGEWSHLDVDLHNCHLHDIRPSRAIFLNPVSFVGAQFHGEARFDGVEFHGKARFDGVEFHGLTWFSGAKFHDLARFDGTQFHDSTWFVRALFRGLAWFVRAQFHDTASFDEAQFHDTAWFDRAQFHDTASFVRAQFCKDVKLGDFRGKESKDMFTHARFKQAKATMVKNNADIASEELFENAIFSASCPTDSKDSE